MTQDKASIQEARRAAFEKTMHRKAMENKYQHMKYLLLKNDDGSYRTTWVDMAWMGYNEALDSVVVELPRPNTRLSNGRTDAECEALLEQWESDCEAIEAAGIRCEVKS